MVKGSSVSCLSFGEKEFKILVTDSGSGRVERRESVVVDFELFDQSGVIGDPILVAARLQNIFDQLNLPDRVKVSLNLRYLDLKRLALPAVTGEELTALVRDEAARESIFSFSGEKIATAYRALGRPLEGGSAKTEVLAATTLQATIASIQTVFKSTNLQLLSIQPSLIGLEHALSGQTVAPGAKVKMLLYTTPADAELYIWEGATIQFWRYLTVGTAAPEQFQTEILASLDHFRKRVTKEMTVYPLIMVGENITLELGQDYQVEYLLLEKWTDLWGLGLGRRDEPSFNFIKASPGQTNQEPDSTSHSWWLVAVVALLLINLWFGGRLWTEGRQAAALAAQNDQLRQSIMTKKNQLGLLQQQPGATLNTTGLTSQLPQFLDQLRRIVPANLRFSLMKSDLETRSMQLDGVCLSPIDFAVFLNKLAQLPGINAVTIIDSDQQGQSFLAIYTFKLNIVLEEFRNE